MKRYELTGDIEWYLTTGDAECGKRSEHTMDLLVNEDGSLSSPMQPEDLPALLYWFWETKKEKYEKAFIREAGNVKMSISTMPFFMAYDTKYYKKEHYSSMVTEFYNKTELTADDLVALADTIGQMSEEIYEHYRALIELLKKNLKICMTESNRSINQQIKAGYAALKGYNVGVLQNEAYLMFGTKIWKSTAECGDDIEAGMMKKFHAQYLLSGK